MRPSILWVEDNGSDVILVRQALADIGLDVDLIVAPNAVKAFSYMAARHPYVLRRDPPDLILVDINLPAINGMVVLNELRAHKIWKSVPIIVLTSSDNSKELQTCKTLGASECITKPASFDGYLEVMRRLQSYLPQSGSTKRSTTTHGSPYKSAITHKQLDERAKPASQSRRPAAG